MTTPNKVIVSNIGNRSLIYSGEGGPLKSIEAAATIKGKTLPKTGYRNDTDELLKLAQMDSQILSELRINILDALLNKKCQETSHLYLIVSDQVEENAQHIKQDTLHAGKLIKLLIEQNEHYKHIEVAIITYQNSVVDADKLIPFYREELSKLLSKHKEQTFIICDSGGTPQQKTSLKISAEYLIPEKQVEYYQIIEQVNDEGEIILGQSGFIKQGNYEYRKIIDAQQIALLIHNGNYEAATFIYDSNDVIAKQLRATSLRKQLLLQDARNIINGTRDDKLFSSLKTLKSKSLGNYSGKEGYFESEHFNILAETLSVADFFYGLKELNNAVLYYHIFMEKCLNALISKQIPQYNLMDSETYFDNSTQLCQYICQNNLVTIFNGRPSNLTLPVKLDYVQSNIDNTNEQLSLCLSYFQKWIRANFSVIRNRIAHDGIGVKGSEINAVSDNFHTEVKEWYKFFGLPKENIYIQTNKEITRALKFE
ncbi:MAG: hypothetical protein IPN94_24835 [Sphingobacteriales bacterium]|nr:hypothetical protein [Sphingobacteriales bacterium]